MGDTTWHQNHTWHENHITCKLNNISSKTHIGEASCNNNIFKSTNEATYDSTKRSDGILDIQRKSGSWKSLMYGSSCSPISESEVSSVS